jgi:hypothetical protein
VETADASHNHRQNDQGTHQTLRESDGGPP